MVKADFVTGLAFVALGIATVVESLRMPAFAELDAEPYTAPGIVPGLLGAALALLGALLSLRAAAGPRPRPSGDRQAPIMPGRGSAPRSRSAWSMPASWSSRIPFQLATFLFIVAFILTFELWDARLRARWRRQTIIAVGLAALLAFGISYVFEAIFLIRLP